jgi:D-3-phosphoglycerate dehydrogenase
VVGRIGSILGEHGINIANFALGRAPVAGASRGSRVPQGQALAVVQIDVPNSAVAAPALADLKAVEAIASVRLVELAKS